MLVGRFLSNLSIRSIYFALALNSIISITSFMNLFRLNSFLTKISLWLNLIFYKSKISFTRFNKYLELFFNGLMYYSLNLFEGEGINSVILIIVFSGVLRSCDSELR